MSNGNSETGVKKRDGLILQIVISVVCAAVGILLLFVQEVQESTLCSIFCYVLLAAGVVSIIAFFATKGHRRLHDYRFAYGVVLLVLGVVGLIRADALVAGLTVCIGLVTLVLAVVILQGFVQLRVVGNRIWIVELVLTVLSLAGSILVLLSVKPIFNLIKDFPYWVLTCVGIFSLVSLLLVWAGLKYSNREVKQEEPEAPAPACEPVPEAAPVFEEPAPTFDAPPADDAPPAEPPAESADDPFNG
ncbi:MAG: DUF308 domain-containing protein [Oscillospiraceae bacterium]|nr:DUF308 domain-containing protein [Oscillospiraceae bacterium]